MIDRLVRHVDILALKDFSYRLKDKERWIARLGSRGVDRDLASLRGRPSCEQGPSPLGGS
jgi:hypothetical protein